MDEEMRFHLDKLTERYEREGISPIRARRLALIEFGGLERNREHAREVVRLAPLDRLLRDVRYGARVLTRTPLTTAAVVLTLAIGIGGVTALFGILDRFVFRRLDVPHPDALAAVVGTRAGDVSESMSYPAFRSLEGVTAVGRVAGYAFRTAAIDAGADSAIVQLTSDDWFETVGVHPVVGRVWGAAPADQETALISDAMRRRRFGSASNAVGTSIELAGHRFTVIGVMNPGFSGISLDFPVDVWVPIAAEPQFDGVPEFADPWRNWVRVITRLGDAQTTASGDAAANAVFASYRRAYMPGSDSTERLSLVRAAQPMTRDRSSVERGLFLAITLAVLVLLIACANVANLQLARSSGRRREIAVRMALGAGRSSLIRQLLTENAMLALFGGALGLWIAVLASRTLTGVAASQQFGAMIGSLTSSVVNLRTLVFTIALSMASALGFGLLPAIRATGLDPAWTLRQTGFLVRGRSGYLGISSLLVIQLATSVVLLISALMVAATLREVLTLDLGFGPRELLQVAIDWRGVPDSTSRREASAIASAIRAIPGVVTASVSSPAGFGRATTSTEAYHVGDDRSRRRTIEYQVVTPEFFAAMDMRLIRGRPFTPDDRGGVAPVVVVNETAARELFRGQAAIGQRFDLFQTDHRVEVVGVVHDARLHGATSAAPPMLYVPLAQDEGAAFAPELTIEVRTRASTVAAEAIARAVRLLDSRRKLDVRPVDRLITESLVIQRITAWTTGAFGVLGVILAMLGVYGLHAYVVARRTAELGIRLALGASRSRVLWDVWRGGMRPVGIGAVCGLGVAALSATWLRGRIFGLSGVDVRVAAAAVATVIAIAGVACLIPARFAARLDPARALRAD